MTRRPGAVGQAILDARLLGALLLLGLLASSPAGAQSSAPDLRALPTLAASGAPPGVAAAQPSPAADVPRAPQRFDVTPSATPGHASGITRCELCHTVASWRDAKFDHDKTGFPLEGGHLRAGCRDCHERGLEAALPRTCAGCHRDAHAGELGQHCEGCHTPRTWASLFGADAHRRTNFPLQGRHAVIPCTECHGEVRDRVFTRAASPCEGCHLRQYLATATGSAVNHTAFGFSTRCRECHNTFRFRPARFPEHERCFSLTAPHGGIACLTCHRSLTGATPNGTCSTGTAACSSCHAHVCSRMDSVHREVAGYECQDLKCYQCHSFAGGTR
jgi:hypothetical protein